MLFAPAGRNFQEFKKEKASKDLWRRNPSLHGRSGNGRKSPGLWRLVFEVEQNDQNWSKYYQLPRWRTIPPFKQKWARMKKMPRSLTWLRRAPGLRVRGNIETNMYTRDLTMNVQDVQEVKKEIRKDLMPDDQKRVEFHAHTNMSTMDALTRSKTWLPEQPNGAHKASPSPTMPMSNNSPLLPCLPGRQE